MTLVTKMNDSSVLARFLAVAALLLAACGGDDVAPSEDTNGADNVRFEQPAPTSNNDDNNGPCTGCLDDEDACLAGDTVEACGDGGAVCVACVGDEQCVDGSCTQPMSGDCGPDNCDGCCTSEGQCVAGGADDACGLGGSACTTCAEDAECNAGVCDSGMTTEPCGPENCNGCCDATGACVGGVAANACGAGGAQCSDCSATGAACNAGMCEQPQPACATTCQGCCEGETCITATDDSQCGSAGAMCIACGADEICSMGACVPNSMPSNDEWDIVMVSATIPSTKLNGDSWDPGGGLPDVVAELYAEDATLGGYWSNYTSIARNDLNPAWDQLIFANVTNEALQGGVAFYLYDDEFAIDDICFQVETVDPTMINPGQEIVTTCVDDPRVEWTWRIDRATP